MYFKIPLISNWLEKRKRDQQIRIIAWCDDLKKAGFEKVVFPCVVVWETSSDYFCVISTLEEYSYDPDLHYWEWGNDAWLIDSLGQMFDCGYNKERKFNYPKQLIKTMSLDEFKKIMYKNLGTNKLEKLGILRLNNIGDMLRMFEKNR